MTAKRLRELLEYNPETGVFKWLNLPWRRDRIGKQAGSKVGRYCYIMIDGKYQLAHRLAWLYVYGEWPRLDIDHINGDCRDNKIANLREASAAQNACNCPARKNNKTGYKGVFPKRNKFAAQIRLGAIRKTLGSFDTPEQAYAAYCEAARDLHGEFAGGVS